MIELHHTWTRCNRCGRVVPALRTDKRGDAYLVWDCPSCGRQERLFFKDARLLKRLEALASKDKRCRGTYTCVTRGPCDRHLSKTSNLMLNVTDRCDMSCPVCLAGANESPGYEPTVEQVMKALPEPPVRDRPNVCIIGGEPTVRKDLPDLVKAVRMKGYIPRLNTNGRRLARNPELAARLLDSGLKWIILQFDGLDDKVYMQLRGMPLLDEKRRVTRMLLDMGFKVQYAVMVARGVNDHQVSDILDEALEQGVFWVSLYPASNVNRDELHRETHLSEVLHALEKTTNQRIRVKDLLASMRVLGLLYKLTGKEVFRQKAFTVPTVLFKGTHGLVPFTRPFGRVGYAMTPALLKSLARGMPGILDFENKNPPRNVLFLTVKKFQSASAMDLAEASDCQMSWVVPGGLVAFDVFNAWWRQRELWKGEKNAKPVRYPRDVTGKRGTKSRRCQVHV